MLNWMLEIELFLTLKLFTYDELDCLKYNWYEQNLWSLIRI